MNCAQITPRIFVGPCPYDHDDFQSLKAESVTATLGLLTADDADDLGMVSEDASANAAGLAFRNMPVTDFDGLDLKRKLTADVEVLDDLLKQGTHRRCPLHGRRDSLANSGCSISALAAAVAS